MRRYVGGTLVVLLACQIPAGAEEHLIPREAMQARLNAAAAERAVAAAHNSSREESATAAFGDDEQG
jgi:hypothetical protein